MIGRFKLDLATKGGAFDIATMGAGISWPSGKEAKLMSLDLAGAVGGDSYNVSIGFMTEF